MAISGASRTPVSRCRAALRWRYGSRRDRVPSRERALLGIFVVLAALNPIADARSENAPRQDKESPRKLFVYISDDGDILGIRYDNFKFVFLEQRCKGTMEVWGEPFTRFRIPKLYNLRTDPYEFADVTSNSYWDWYIYHGYMILAAQRIAGAFADTFKEFPAIQRPNSFTIDDALRAMSEAASGGKQ